MKVSEYIAKFLENQSNIFTVSGAGNLSIIHEIKKLGKSKLICNLHEQACTIASYSNSRLTNNIGVSVVTTGPGATNAITGVTTAWLDSTAILVISGQVPTKQTIKTIKEQNGIVLRTNGPQEINIVDIVTPITKFATTIYDAKSIRYNLEKAIYISKSGRPGPVWLDIPQDIQNIDIGNPCDLIHYDVPDTDLKEDDLDNSIIAQILDLIYKSTRPIIIWGYGVESSKCESKMREFCDTIKAPLLVSWKTIDDVEEEYPYYIGRFGIFGQRAANFTIQNADLIINVGSRLGIPQIGYNEKDFAREAKIITIDIDPNENKKYLKKPDISINSSAGKFLHSIFDKIDSNKLQSYDNWLFTCLDWKRRYPVCLPEYRESQFVNSYHFIDELSNLMEEGDIFIPNASGTAYTCTHQTVKVKKGQKIITSNNLAEMGYDLPAAIGVAVENHSKRVILVTGDGSFQMNIQELQTIINYKLNVKIFYLNNNGYMTIRNTQKTMFDGQFAASDESDGLNMPNIEKIAYAYGFKYYKMQNRNNLIECINNTLLGHDPTICEIILDPNQTCYPKTSLRVDNDVRFQMPLEDMFPFLPREEFKKQMIVKIHPNSDYE
jgi:acetolactate synthase-1/2/3 large subunit